MLNANSAAPEKLEKSPRLEEGLVRGGGGSSGRVRSARESLESLATPPTNGAGWMSIAFSEAAASSFREERYGVRLGCVGRSVARQVTTLRANPGSLITLGIAAVYALVADLDKLGKLHSDDLLVFIFLQRCFLLAPPLTYVMVKNPAAFNVFTKTKKVGCALALIGFLDIASMYAFLQSLNYIFTSYAVAAKRTSILASVVGGALFFKEPIARRLPYIFIMFIGMALILIADADKH
jgi:drug/metabolite transporter (DMT)-like permease